MYCLIFFLVGDVRGNIVFFPYIFAGIFPVSLLSLSYMILRKVFQDSTLVRFLEISEDKRKQKVIVWESGLSDRAQLLQRL
jgi:hypothetical protein